MYDLLSLDSLLALITLTCLEIVLGIDNIVFLAITTSHLPEHQRPRARRVGLFLAMFMRILLLFMITLVMRLTTTLFSVWGHAFSGRDLILLAGGLFLIAKATFEIHDKLEPPRDDQPHGKIAPSFKAAIFQIVLLDIIFSLDSVITAVGMAQHLEIMVTAVVCSVIVMMFFADLVSDFVERHPTVKMLAMSFLLLIGVFLTADGLGKHIEKGYIYFAMGFSLLVEFLNLKARHQ